MQQRAMHHDVIGADGLRVARELEHHVKVGVGAGGDDAGPATGHGRRGHGSRCGLHCKFKRALALGYRHRKKLALLAADKQATQFEGLDPVRQVVLEAGFVKAKPGVKRRGSRSPHTAKVCAGVGFGVGFAVFQGGFSSGAAAPDARAVTNRQRRYFAPARCCTVPLLHWPAFALSRCCTVQHGARPHAHATAIVSPEAE